MNKNKQDLKSEQDIFKENQDKKAKNTSKKNRDTTKKVSQDEDKKIKEKQKKVIQPKKEDQVKNTTQINKPEELQKKTPKGIKSKKSANTNKIQANSQKNNSQTPELENKNIAANKEILNENKDCFKIWDLYFGNSDNEQKDFSGTTIQRDKYAKKEWDIDHIVPQSKCKILKESNLIPNFECQSKLMNLQPTHISINRAKAEKLCFEINNVQYRVYYNKSKNREISSRDLFCGEFSKYNKYVQKNNLIDIYEFLKEQEEKSKQKLKDVSDENVKSSNSKNQNKNCEELKCNSNNEELFVNRLFGTLQPKCINCPYSITAFSIKFSEQDFFSFFIRIKKILSTLNYSFNNFLVKVDSASYFLHIYSESFLQKKDKICPDMLANFIKLIAKISKLEGFAQFVEHQFFWSYDFNEQDKELHHKIAEIWETIPHIFWKQSVKNQVPDVKFFVNQRIKEILFNNYEVNVNSLAKIGKWYKLNEKFFNN